MARLPFERQDIACCCLVTHKAHSAHARGGFQELTKAPHACMREMEISVPLKPNQSKSEHRNQRKSEDLQFIRFCSLYLRERSEVRCRSNVQRSSVWRSLWSAGPRSTWLGVDFVTSRFGWGPKDRRKKRKDREKSFGNEKRQRKHGETE